MYMKYMYVHIHVVHECMCTCMYLLEAYRVPSSIHLFRLNVWNGDFSFHEKYPRPHKNRLMYVHEISTVPSILDQYLMSSVEQN